MQPEEGNERQGRRKGPYYEWLLVDVMEVQREDVVFAADIHTVMVLIHSQYAVVGGVEQEGEMVSGASCLQLYGKKKQRNQLNPRRCIYLQPDKQAILTQCMPVPLKYSYINRRVCLKCLWAISFKSMKEKSKVSLTPFLES